MEKHQGVALALFLAVALWLLFRDGAGEDTWARILILLLTLVPIMIYRVIAYFAGIGFPEFLASDYGGENNPAPYAVLFWIVFLLACLSQIFQWSLY